MRNILLALLCVAAWTEDSTPSAATADAAPDSEAITSVINVQGRQMTLHHGQVVVGDDLATIALPADAGYLGAGDARFLLEKVWNNPPDPEVLGLVLPGGDSEGAVVVSYEKSGHVKDEDARDLDYHDLLTQMQKDTHETNATRQRQGYATMELLGWAEPPHYDQAAHKLYWAKDLQFSDTDHRTLNYCVRVLGRDGVLELNAIDRTENLAVIATLSQAVLAGTELRPGRRYGDFKEGVDHVAAYGVAGLIAGGLLLKGGLGKLLLAFIKPILVGVFAIGAAAMRLFKRKQA